MKKTILLFLSITIMSISISACSPNNIQPSTTEPTDPTGNLKIITTLFPQYDFAKQIAGDKADVTLLLNPGTEAHSFDPTPANIIKINQSDLFIYTGEYMESWAYRIIDTITNENLTILDVSKGIVLHENVDKHDDHDHSLDPHIWTSPVIAKIMVENISSQLSTLDPINAAYYKQNTFNYIKELDNLDSEFKQIVETSLHKDIFFGGRFALYYFTDEYGLNPKSAYDNCSSETEPSVADIAEIITAIKEKNITAIYYEELSDPKVAKTISDATNAEMLLFHSCHNISDEDFKAGANYISLMKQNGENLRKGLN